MLFIIVLMIFSSTVSQYVDGCLKHIERPCITFNGTAGNCVEAKRCPRINRLIGHSTSDELEFVTKSICGRDVDTSRLFCCDINEVERETEHGNKTSDISSQDSLNESQHVGQGNSTTINGSGIQVQTITTSAPYPVVNVTQSVPMYCKTPNGERAQCVPLNECPRILSIILDNPNEDKKRYLRESKCGYSQSSVLVCCGKDEDFKKLDETEGEERNFAYNTLISNNNCGIETDILEEQYLPLAITTRRKSSQMNFTLPNRVFGGADSAINEFPWVALLEYESAPQKKSYSCGGSLISSKYVLTAAHCLVMTNMPIVNVRLGEWNYKNPDRNCASTNKGKVCLDEAINIGVESIIVHPAYTRGTKGKFNDIGLVRLKKDVEFKNHITPVCLPKPNEYLAPGERLTLTGWGLKNYDEMSSIKQKVNIPIVSSSQCSVMFEKNDRLNWTLGKGQFCAGGEAGRDACVGDSGAPLMKRYNSTSGPPRWYIEGIVSFGTGCGIENFYGVYTKVSKYVRWIHETIVP